MSETHTQLIDTVIEILRKMGHAAAPAWFHLDISIAQMRTLFVLSHHHAATMSTIAQALGVGLPTASHLVEKLVRSGLVQRAEDPKDRRQTLVCLTRPGADLIENISQERLELLRSWLSQLTEEELTALWVGVRALARVAETVRSNAEPRQPEMTSHRTILSQE